MRFKLSLLLFLSLIGSTNNSTNNNAIPLKKAIDIVTKASRAASLTTEQQASLALIHGEWLIENYIDAIYRTQSIQKNYSKNHLVQQALFINIQDSLIQVCGTIDYIPKKEKHSFNLDSLFQIKTYRDQFFTLYYDKIQNKLALKSSDSKTIFLRRFTKRESKFLSRKEVTDYENGFNKLMNKVLFTGTYQLDKSPNIVIQFLTNGTIQGWDKYQSYHIKNWFGTLHWLPNDMVYLKTKEGEIETWTWSFKLKKSPYLTLKKVLPLEKEDGMKVTEEKLVLIKL